VATPIDLRRLIRFDRPAVRVSYDLDPISQPDLSGPVMELLRNGSARR
jgi:predicted GTPase